MRSKVHEVVFFLSDRRRIANFIVEFESLIAKHNLSGAFELHRVFEEVVIYRAKKRSVIDKIFGILDKDLISQNTLGELADMIDSVRI